MHYEATVVQVVFDDCDGFITVRINGHRFQTYYRASVGFTESVVRPSRTMAVDLWHVFGKARMADTERGVFPLDVRAPGGTIVGEVISVFSPREFRVDCGKLIIDVENRVPFQDVCSGAYIETTGTYQVFFPGTEYSREEMTTTDRS